MKAATSSSSATTMFAAFIVAASVSAGGLGCSASDPQGASIESRRVQSLAAEAAAPTTAPGGDVGAGQSGVIAPQAWHIARRDAVSAESIEELIAHLGNFDDQHLAETSFSGLAISDLSANRILITTRLTRVRRLLAEGRARREQVIPPLRAALKDVLRRWPGIFLEQQKQGYFDQFDGGPSPYGRCIEQAVAATYLLAELNDHASLPLLVEVYDAHIDDYNVIDARPRPQKAPVAPAITIYAMHRLISSYPTAGLSDTAKNHRQRYLRLARELFPDVTETKVIQTWQSNYGDDDPRIAVLDPARKTLQGQPTMNMAIYPVTLRNGEPTGDMIVNPKVKTAVEEIKLFIAAR